MLSPDDKRFIKLEIARQLNVILAGSAGSNSSEKETIEALYPGSPSITDRPVMHPYGFVSRAPRGTISVTARHGDHPGNRITLGHRDKKRPTEVEENEAGLYHIAGFRVRLKKDGIYLSKGSTSYSYILGEPLIELLSTLLDELIAHTHAAPGSPPANAAQFTNLKAQYIVIDKLTSTSDGGFK